MEYAQESIVVKNDPIMYPYRLECDDIAGIIRLHKNTAKGKTTTITTRNILVTDKARVSMNMVRTGYYDKKKDPTLPFNGSYISKEADPETYVKWRRLMVARYKEFKNNINRQIGVNEVDREKWGS